MLPPNIDGYRRYCPYTIDPRADGRYTGPDLAKARRLVAASGTRARRDRLDRGIFQPHGGAYFVSVLRASATEPASGASDDRRTSRPWETRGRRSRPAYRLGSGLPVGGQLLPVLLTAARSVPRSADNQNLAEFCDPRIDAEIARARSLQTSDPRAASRLWNKIDRDIVDQAPWVSSRTCELMDFVSRRVGNYQYNPQWRVLLDQLWVK